MGLADLIAAKRDGAPLSAAQLGRLVAGMADGTLSDAQLGALAMAMWLQGLSRDECVAMTGAMRDSGTRLRWRAGPVLDKHSTGGVGDTVSLVLAPALAACGAVVPMISGQGLGHTGGTLDKLSAIPGYATHPSLGTLRKVVEQAGCAIVGASTDLAPADRRFYAVRDATATVDSRALIVASILSKKLAAGLDGLVLDVKCGSGAFMRDADAARALADELVAVARAAGCPARALVTAMDQPLADAAGNAVELRAALRVLQGDDANGRLRALVCALGAEALTLAGRDDGAAALGRALDTGAAAERFARMVAGLGGPADLLDRLDHHVAAAPVIRPVPPPHAGYLAEIDTRALGRTVIALGGGRQAAGDMIDTRVGLSAIARLGDAVGPDGALAMVHAADADSAARAADAVQAACRVDATPPSTSELVMARR